MLKQTKGYSKLRGIITGLTDGKKEPVEILSFGTKLSFGLATSENSRIFVNVLAFNGAENRDVYFGSIKRGNPVIKKPYNERYEQIEGYRLLGINLKANASDEVTILTDEDSIQYIVDNFKDGDSVFIEAELSKFVSGDKVGFNNKIRKMFATTKPIDFEAEDFEEMAEFKDTFVFSEATFNKSQKKGKIEGYYIDYKFEPTLVNYAINVKDKDDYAIYEYFEKNVKFGDLVEVEGVLHNRVIGHREEVVEESKAQQEPLVGKKAKSFTNSGGKTRFIKDSEQKEMEITAITSVDKGVYTLAQLKGEETNTFADDDDKLPWE